MCLKKIESELKKKENELRELRKENRQLRCKIKELAASSSVWKDKFLTTKKKLKMQALPCSGSVTSRIDRHKYDALLVDLSVNIYVLGRSGFRRVVSILSYLNKTLQWDLKQLPCKSSVENWVQKAGYHIYANVDDEKYQDGYGIIVDECMVVGQERMLAVLGVPAAKTVPTALNLGDVDILALKVKTSWDGAAVEAMVQSVTEKMGKPALYAISDGATNLRMGLYKAGIPRICDSGHQLAL
ncbi:hypothetical protein [Dyadobacter sp. LHD-138]|uniref:hypothetical protein n=1 Tax=Dyadobacter sp. LHD-138 TaxID=3071413 RepID=UPI0027DF9D6A|nr:hypothetical protein [Dyadobacter sp. LHD-138]MDQ6480551.1 hypothetical protein [Dyadobacter sp. LHD-138]